ncbi:UNVERIFIED_ORG: putative membrane protein [Arthrobacter sp. UYEF10]
MMGGNGFMWGSMWFFWLLVVMGVVLLVILAVRAFSGGIGRRGGTPGDVRGADHLSPPAGRSTARRILDERYASGALSAEEYAERLKVLGEDH